MDYRVIVVHIDDSDRSEPRLEFATHVARVFDARLVGVYLVPTREMTPFTSAMLPDTVVLHRLRDSGAAQSRAEERFREASSRAGLVDIEWRAPAGPPLEAVAVHARYADITIIGQPAPDDAHPAFSRDLAHASLVGAGRPVLVVPFAGAPSPPAKNVLVAWNESRESARAVADALPWLRKAMHIVVMSITDSDDEGIAETRADRNIAEYLQCHDIPATIQHEVAAESDLGGLLLSRAALLGSDLLVMGDHSRPRLQQLVSGDVTQSMLNSMTIPVLMSH